MALVAFAFVSTYAQQAPVSVSGGATSDIIRLATAGIGNDVLLAYVNAARTPFNLSADDIINLSNAKVGALVIQAMLTHATTVVAQATAEVVTPPQTQYIDDPLYLGYISTPYYYYGNNSPFWGGNSWGRQWYPDGGGDRHWGGGFNGGHSGGHGGHR